jgi:hypothetical protein
MFKMFKPFNGSTTFLEQSFKVGIYRHPGTVGTGSASCTFAQLRKSATIADQEIS